MKKAAAALAVAVATAALAGVAAQPAPAIIDEIVASWCSGKGALEPAGLADGKNFAKPVFAGGVVQLTPYLDGVLIDFDFDAPQSKIRAASSGPAIVQIAPGLYFERFELDHVAFEKCKGLNP